MEEGEGFEPSRRERPTGLANRPLEPLGYPSSSLGTPAGTRTRIPRLKVSHANPYTTGASKTGGTEGIRTLDLLADHELRYPAAPLLRNRSTNKIRRLKLKKPDRLLASGFIG